MKNLKVFIHSIKTRPDNNEIASQLLLLRQEIDKLFLKIKNCDCIKSANCYFNSLEDAQDLIASLIFKEKINITNDLWKFFKDFDRIDDKEEREYFFNAIKNNLYSLNL